ncbi:MAG TPA: hypothetical protein VN328_04895 [Thermodesulfovibrionales bacterium]|nr:hypothetical protein [Thermodesulfovibrionales bacterium]
MKIISINSSSLKGVLFLVLLFFAFSSWFQKIGNLDFWWHIKTGQYILENRALPDKDPFTYTFLEHDIDSPEMPAVVLKSYWLSQVIFYLIFEHFGPLGIVLLKVSVFALILMVFWKYLVDRSASSILTFIMLAGFVVFSGEHVAERPQIFSFLFAAIVFYLLENIRTECRIQDEKTVTKNASFFVNQASCIMHLVWLPVIMLLWANIHRGYMVGITFIMVYGAALAIRKVPLQAKAPALVMCIASICITLLNPVSYHSITSFVSSQGGAYRNEPLEFNPLFRVIPLLSRNAYPFLGLLIVAAIVVVTSLISSVSRFAFRRAQGDNVMVSPSIDSGQALSNVMVSLSNHPTRLPLEHLLLLIGTAIASLSSVRYAMFFMIVAVPIVTVYLTGRFRLWKEWLPFERIAIVILSLVLLLLSFRSSLFMQPRGDLVDAAAFPANAVEFMQRGSLQPRIFNDINWGGYLIWKLYPGYQVFSDTRALNLEIYRQYLSILRANKTKYGGKPEWKALLDMYSINTIIHSTVNPHSGEIWPLMLELLRDGGWHLIYADGMAAILARKMPPGFSELPKGVLIEQIRQEVLGGLSRFPGHPGFSKTLDMLNILGGKQSDGSR